MFEQYAKLLKRDNMRILLYNGDTDMACNFLGDEWFVDRLQASLLETRSRAPWYVGGQDAGFAKSYKSIDSSATLTYTTIRVSASVVKVRRSAYTWC